MTSKSKVFLGALFFSVLTASFQNCSKSVHFAQDLNLQNAPSETEGNGGNYDGKLLSYLLSNGQLCSDGSLIQSRIDKMGSQFLLLRENCVNFPTAKALSSSAVTLSADQSQLIYEGQTYLLSRDPWLQPFSSLSLWNTSIGSGAQWSANTDADTKDLHTPGAGIVAGNWSVPYFLASSTDPTKLVQDQDTDFPVPDQTLFFPADFHFSLPTGTSNAFVLMDPSKRWLYHYSGCQETASGLSCAIGEKDDSCGQGLSDYDLGSGIMRTWELQSGEIKHMLRYALPTTLNKSGTTWTTGLAWPATHEDYNGPKTYSGNILFGSTVGIPANVDVNSLGLSQGGLILAKALQDYGALQRDNSGSSGGIVFFAEESAEPLPQLAEMRADVDKIVPYLRVMRNQSASTLNGGGSRRKTLLLPLDPKVCGQ